MSRVHLACSAGGHIDLLMRVRGALGDREQVWVTQRSQRADALVNEGARVRLLPDYDRHPLKGRLLTTVWRSLGLVVRERPRLVVTTGSGLVVPFCLIARLLGATLVFVETSARVSGPSRSGFLLSRIAQSTIVQWPPMLEVYRGSKLARSSVLEQILVKPARDAGEGTFVGVGMHIYPFDRLLRLVDDAVGRGILPGPVVAQTGVSDYHPTHFEAIPWLEPDELEQAVRRACYVVSHAGSGLLATALSSGRRPLVLARRGVLGEHFDDHQEQITGELGRLGLVVPLADAIGPEHVAAARAPLEGVDEVAHTPSVADRLHDEVLRLEGACR